MLPDIEAVRDIVVAAAAEELLPRFADSRRMLKADGSLVTEADLAMQRRMQGELTRRWPQFGFLGEEMEPGTQQALLTAEGPGLWCLDPVDGTSNFAAGLPFFAVSLALLRRGEPVLGIVYDPVRGECFTAVEGEGAWLNGDPLRSRRFDLPLRQALAAVDFKRLAEPLAVRLVTQPPYGSQRSFGSVALDWCWVAAGRFHVYLHGRQKLWDYAAGSLVLKEAGGQAMTLEGEAVLRADNRPRSAVAALDPALFEEWCRWLGIG